MDHYILKVKNLFLWTIFNFHPNLLFSHQPKNSTAHISGTFKQAVLSENIFLFFKVNNMDGFQKLNLVEKMSQTKLVCKAERSVAQ